MNSLRISHRLRPLHSSQCLRRSQNQHLSRSQVRIRSRIQVRGRSRSRRHHPGNGRMYLTKSWYHRATVGKAWRAGERMDELPSDHPLSGAYRALRQGDYPAAKKMFEHLSPEYPQAHLYLGWIYENGLGVQRDVVAAEKNYRMLSERNDASGIYYLASLLRRQKPKEAFDLYKR